MLITDNENELKLLVSEGVSERPTNGATGDIDGYICQKDKRTYILTYPNIQCNAHSNCE